MLCTRGFLGWACSNFFVLFPREKPRAASHLRKAGIPSVSHRLVYEMTMACRRAGCKVASGVKFDGLVPDNHALILPPNSAKDVAPDS